MLCRIDAGDHPGVGFIAVSQDGDRIAVLGGPASDPLCGVLERAQVLIRADLGARFGSRGRAALRTHRQRPPPHAINT